MVWNVKTWEIPSSTWPLHAVRSNHTGGHFLLQKIKPNHEYVRNPSRKVANCSDQHAGNRPTAVNAELGIFHVIFTLCGTIVTQNAKITLEIPSSVTDTRASKWIQMRTQTPVIASYSEEAGWTFSLSQHYLGHRLTNHGAKNLTQSDQRLIMTLIKNTRNDREKCTKIVDVEAYVPRKSELSGEPGMCKTNEKLKFNLWTKTIQQISPSFNNIVQYTSVQWPPLWTETSFGSFAGGMV